VWDINHIPPSTIASITIPWDQSQKEYSLKDWDESKLQGALTRQEFEGLLSELKKCPSYSAEYYSEFCSWDWLWILLPIFGWVILIFELAFNYEKKNRHQEARKYEFLRIIKPWNQAKKEANAVHIKVGGFCAGFLQIYIIPQMRLMTEEEIINVDAYVPSELLKYSLDGQAKTIKDA